MDKRIYDSYIAILEHELVPALGCTEPIAIAYAAAKARDVLGALPERIAVRASGNVIKNVKSVIVPNSNNERGIETAVALGCAGGDASLGYEVLQPVTQKDIARAKQLVKEGFCDTRYVEGKDNLYIRIEAVAGDARCEVTVEHEHTNVSRIVKNGQVVYSAESKEAPGEAQVDNSTLNVRDIFIFANELNV